MLRDDSNDIDNDNDHEKKHDNETIHSHKKRAATANRKLSRRHKREPEMATERGGSLVTRRPRRQQRKRNATTKHKGDNEKAKRKQT